MEISRRIPEEVHRNGEIPLIPPQIITIIGPELSGKSEHGRILAARTNLPLIEMGKIFRDLYEEDSELAARARAVRGRYADETLFKDVFEWGIKDKEGYENGFIIEGAPRSLSQFRTFPEIVRLAGGEDLPIKVAFLNVTKDQAHVRQSSREAREDDALLDSRLNEHYTDLDEKIRAIREYASVFAVIPTVERNEKTGAVVGDRLLSKVNDDIVEKLGIDKTQIRSFSEAQRTDVTREILNLAHISIQEIGHDIMTLPKSKRPSAILAYIKNVNDTLAESSFTGPDLEEFVYLRRYLENLYAQSV